MTELKPCPFCGGEAMMQYGYPRQQGGKWKKVFVKCKVCKAKTQTIDQLPFQAWEECKKRAKDAWNRRAE